jgi:hypothetical protein
LGIEGEPDKVSRLWHVRMFHHASRPAG